MSFFSWVFVSWENSLFLEGFHHFSFWFIRKKNIIQTTKFNHKILFWLIEKTCAIQLKRVVDLNSILFKNKSREKENSLKQKSLSHENYMCRKRKSKPKKFNNVRSWKEQKPRQVVSMPTSTPTVRFWIAFENVHKMFCSSEKFPLLSDLIVKNDSIYKWGTFLCFEVNKRN